MILNGSKNKNPCCHRTISIQIDSPLPQDDTQAVSRQSDVVLNNKNPPNIIFYIFCLWFWMALKIKVPVSTDQFQFRLTVHYTRMTLKTSFKTIWCCITQEKLSKSHILPVMPIQIDRRLSLWTFSLDVTHSNWRLSDITLPNLSCLKAHLLLVLKDPLIKDSLISDWS